VGDDQGHISIIDNLVHYKYIYIYILLSTLRDCILSREILSRVHNEMWVK